jgi:hypothetical protein
LIVSSDLPSWIPRVCQEQLEHNSATIYPGGTVTSSGLDFVLVGSDLCLTGWLKFGTVPTPNSCGHVTGGGMCVMNHGHVLSRVVGRLIRTSVFPSTSSFSWLNK